MPRVLPFRQGTQKAPLLKNPCDAEVTYRIHPASLVQGETADGSASLPALRQTRPGGRAEKPPRIIERASLTKRSRAGGFYLSGVCRVVSVTRLLCYGLSARGRPPRGIHRFSLRYEWSFNLNLFFYGFAVSASPCRPRAPLGASRHDGQLNSPYASIIINVLRSGGSAVTNFEDCSLPFFSHPI